MRFHNFIPDILDSIQDYYMENGRRPDKIVVRPDVMLSLHGYSSSPGQLPLSVKLYGVTVVEGNTLFPYRIEDNR